MSVWLYLKETDGNRTVYYYGETSVGVYDGEIEVNIAENSVETLKFATGDEKGGLANRVSRHVCTTVVKMGCPQERYIATG
ncbi:hypothetical protein AGMMS49975_22830 [Clostridia bacterium]|nr:hypothetical protein AGMMS49975_22830 [Clostridia bacterium]